MSDPLTPVPVAVELEAFYRDLLHPEHAPKPAPTGFETLDLLLGGGTVPGDLVYLAAHSSVGKTLMGLQWATTWATRGEAALVVSQEMTARALTRRLVVQQTGIAPRALKAYDLTVGQCRQVASLIERWRTLPLFLTEQARSVTTIEALLEAWPPAFAPRPTLLVVDYLQLTQAPPEIRGYEKVDYVSHVLKALAVRLGLTALVLSATTPGANADLETDVTLYSLRGSRGVSFDADVILLLKRKKGAPVGTLVAEKVRDGEVGTVEVRFRPEILTFEEVPRG